MCVWATAEVKKNPQIARDSPGFEAMLGMFMRTFLGM